MLSRDDIDRFVRDGFIAIRGAVPATVVRACQDIVWQELASREVSREDRGTWTSPVVRINCPEGGPFVEAGTAPVLWEAYDALLGPDRWRRRRGVGGTIPVRFPSSADPGDAGWHIDGSYDVDGEWWANFRSRERGLLALFLFTDVDERHAPTELLVGSHLDVPRALAPAGEVGLGNVIPHLPASTFAREVARATGAAGDVFVCHPFIVHRATWPHRGTEARMVAQPAVEIHQPFTLTGEGTCPVERAIILGLRG